MIARPVYRVELPDMTTRIRSASRFGGVMLVAALLASCARRPPDAEASVPDAASGEPASLVIENASIWDVRIFAVRSTQNLRLGVVTSGQTGTFAIPPSLIARDLTILADPIGARTRLRTDSFVAWPGNEVKITLEKRLRSYGIAIY